MDDKECMKTAGCYIVGSVWKGLGPVKNSVELSSPSGRGPVLLLVE